MPDKSHTVGRNSEESHVKTVQLENASNLCEQVGERLKALAQSPSCEQAALIDLISLTKQLLNQLESLALANERQCERTAKPTISSVQCPIPEKSYYRIGEVAEILNLNPDVLRYWEREFKMVKPTRTRARQRRYSQQDLEILKEITRLQSEEKLSMAGVKMRLEEMCPESTEKKQTSSESKPPPSTRIIIPAKQYYKLNEVSEFLNVEPFVLRYWQAEYNILPPTRTRARQRLYQKNHIEKLLLIKHLLYDQKYTIAGVKIILKKLKDRESTERGALATPVLKTPEGTPSDTSPRPDSSQALVDIGKILQDLKGSQGS